MTLEIEIARLEHELAGVRGALATERARTDDPALSTCVFSGSIPRPARLCRWRIA
jgi:hypothetical protein